MSMDNGPAPAQDSGHSFTSPLSDFDQVAGFFAGWDGRFEQLSSGRFEGRLSLVRGREVRLVSLQCNQVLLARGRLAPGLFALYAVTPANAGGLWQGRRLTPGQFVVHGPDAETNHLSARQLTSVGFSMQADLIEAAARKLTAADLDYWPKEWAAFTPPPDCYSDLNARIQQLLRLALADPTTLASPEGAQLEQECIRAVVRGVVPIPSVRGDRRLSQRGAVVRRAEEFMRASLHQPFGAVDLCAELGVSDRTLRLAFRERFGLGPMTYYRALRLNATRSTLKADPAREIANVASDYGFHHLGNFAADYRRLFGERPSATRASTRSRRT